MWTLWQRRPDPDVVLLLQLSTLPQGTVNMNLCTSLTDAEPKTGQRNGLCIVTPAQETFIRGDSREIINGSAASEALRHLLLNADLILILFSVFVFIRWSEQLTVFLCTNKQNQKKKRKVDPVANQVGEKMFAQEARPKLKICQQRKKTVEEPY